MAELRIEGVSRSFGATRAVNNVSFTARSGSLLSVLGPSGCGKSTILSLVAGFLPPDAGEIFVEGHAITSVPPSKRGIGIVFQSYALFPHMTVFDNVAFGLRMRGQRRQGIENAVLSVLELVHLKGKQDRFPRQLSGGEQQRVALARALVIKPPLLLLDEPLAALDKQIRQSMQQELLEVQRATGVTAIFVTHDQEEAMRLSDRIVVMQAGQVEQIGDPSEIYRRPANRFVAQFIGRSNFVEAVVLESQDGVAQTQLLNGSVAKVRAPGYQRGEKVSVVVRPEHISLERARTNGMNCVEGTVTSALDLGHYGQVHVDVPAVGMLEVSVPAKTLVDVVPKIGRPIKCYWDPEDATALRS